MNVQEEFLCNVAKKAGEIILQYYNSDFTIKNKKDESPVTNADIAANEFICSQLKEKYPLIPIISEEKKADSYVDRKHWKSCFLVDPLDGTREFVKKNGEFTVNIAYIENGLAVMGVIYSPVDEVLYYTEGEYSYKKQNLIKQKLPINISKTFRVVASRSHKNEETEKFIDDLENKHEKFERITIGSSLKFCLIAEGFASVYPRLGHIMEWDVAAAHAIIKNAGGNIVNYHTKLELTYNKESLRSDWFIASL